MLLMLDIQSKFYVKIHVIKDDMDPSSNINYSRKIPPQIIQSNVLQFAMTQLNGGMEPIEIQRTKNGNITVTIASVLARILHIVQI